MSDSATNLRDDFVAASEALGIADPSLVEKDHYILRVLEAVLPVESEVFDIVFGGGTSLSRAYGAIERMSEDADLKLLRKEPLKEISRGAIRAATRRVRRGIYDALDSAGLAHNPENSVAFNEGRLTHLSIPYETIFPQSEALRPEIKLDIFVAEQLHDYRLLPVRSLVEEAFGESPKLEAKVVGITDTAAEKIVCFTRRSAYEIRQGLGDGDPRLVRHVYDICQVAGLLANEALLIQKTETSIVADQNKYGGRHPEFREDVIGEIDRALESLRADRIHRERYEQFVGPMVYGKSPDWDKAVGTFCETTNRAVQGLR